MINNLALRALVAWQGLWCRFEEEHGQTLAEYGLILSVVAVAVIATSVIVFRGSLESMFHDAADCINRVTC